MRTERTPFEELPSERPGKRQRLVENWDSASQRMNKARNEDTKRQHHGLQTRKTTPRTFHHELNLADTFLAHPPDLPKAGMIPANTIRPKQTAQRTSPTASREDLERLRLSPLSEPTPPNPPNWHHDILLYLPLKLESNTIGHASEPNG